MLPYWTKRKEGVFQLLMRLIQFDQYHCTRRQARAPAATATAANMVTASAAAISTKELPVKLPTDELDMHEIAVTATVAAVLLELAAGGLAEVDDRGEVGDDGAVGVELAVEGDKGGSDLVLLAELDVDVAVHVVGLVVTNVEGLDVAELGELLEDVPVAVLEV